MNIKRIIIEESYTHTESERQEVFTKIIDEYIKKKYDEERRQGNCDVLSTAD